MQGLINKDFCCQPRAHPFKMTEEKEDQGVSVDCGINYELPMS